MCFFSLEHCFLVISSYSCCTLHVFQSQNVNTLAKNSQNVSSVLNETALRTKDKVDNELSSLLDDIKSRLDLIKSKIQNVSRDLFDVENNFPEFSEKANSIGE